MKINLRIGVLTKTCTIIYIVLFICGCGRDQGSKSNLTTHTDSLNYESIYGLALKGEVTKALKVLGTLQLAGKDSIYKDKFEKRFKYKTDRTTYLSERDSAMRPLLKIFQKYWRKALTDPGKKDGKVLKSDLLAFFTKKNKNEPFTENEINESTLKAVFDDYMDSKNFYNTEFGKTGKYYDFIVWKTMEPKSYQVGLIDDTVSVTVNFMKSFVSLGWTSYARLGHRYPGGWATEKALYAVAKGYDQKSEKFKIIYLKHEGQHFSDYDHFPKLKSYDLEYRGKLLELYFADEELYNRIAYYLLNAKYDPENAHPFANYCIISDMSQILFDKDYVSEMRKWKGVSAQAIHEASKRIYLENTKQLNQIGKDVEHYLGKYSKCGNYNL